MKCTTVGKDERRLHAREPPGYRVDDREVQRIEGRAHRRERRAVHPRLEDRFAVREHHAVQAQDLFWKIACDRGGALAHVAGEITKFVDSASADGRRKPERALLPSRWRTQG